jgi:hypothetical protein
MNGWQNRQLTLDEYARAADALARKAEFKGQTYDADQDHGRLKAQLGRVKTLMLDGEWRTLAAIATATNDPEASVSARLRDLRRIEHGAWTVERRRVPNGNGLHEYRLLPPKPQTESEAA